MKKCSYADRYKALRAPKCNNGDPCEACAEKYAHGVPETYEQRVIREDAEWEARRAGYEAHAAGVAAALNGAVQVKRDPWGGLHVSITGLPGAPDGAALVLGYPDKYRNDDRLTVGGVWPRGADGRNVVPRDCMPREQVTSGTYSVTVGVTRTPEAIAKDITRRLLPYYFEAYTAGVAYAQRQQEYADGRLQALRKVAMGTGGTLKDQAVYTHGPRVTASDADSVRVEAFYATPAQAIQIINLLKGDE